jgi:putative two-component system response regulator
MDSDHVAPRRGPVLIVDDDDDVRRSTAELLERTGYATIEASDATVARAILDRDPEVPAILCDIRMPGRSGLELLRDVEADFPDTAVVMLTGVDEIGVANAAFEIGAFGYVLKPFARNELLITLDNAFRRRELEIARRTHLRELEGTLARSRSVEALVEDLDIGATDDRGVEDTVERLSRAVSMRHEETGAHLQRMSQYAAAIADATGFTELSPEDVQLATLLHDVGKIGVADSVLLKPGPLVSDEYSAMQRHAHIGHRLLADSSSPLMEVAADIALMHHEWWDGGGYPNGLRGDEIPKGARIAAVADVFDALTSHRVYRPAMSIDEAVSIMTASRGKQFEPRLLDAFIEMLDDVIDIRESIPDGTDDLIRVLVVDDHEIFSESVARILTIKPQVRVVGTAGTVSEAVKAAVAYLPDIILMDYELPDGTGASATHRIKAATPDVKVIMLTGLVDDEVLLRSIEAGCAGFVRKEAGVEELFAAIEAVALGDTTASVRDALALLPRLAPRSNGRGVELRPRECEVLELAASGLANKEIAARLSVSLNTVRNHMQNSLYRLQAHSKLEAIAIAVREGVISRY